jgi:hypothetical protein
MSIAGVYANVYFFLRFFQEELDNLAKSFPDRFKIYYVLNQVYILSSSFVVCLMTCNQLLGSIFLFF